MGVYTGARDNIIRGKGGSVKVTLSSNVGQGNGGTSQPCAGCWVQADSSNTSSVRFNIGAAASANLGVELGRPFVSGTTAAATCQPLWVPLDDVNLLYFYSAQANAVVHITYLGG